MLLGNKLYTPDMPNGVPVPPGTRDLAQITPHNDIITDLSEDYGNTAFNVLTAPETGSIKAGMLAMGLRKGLKTECEAAAKDASDLPKLISNPKHNPFSKSPEPKNVDDLFKKSIPDENGVRWAKDEDGVIHRFSKPSNGESHWNGSTGGNNPNRTATNGMTSVTHLKFNTGSSFTLLTCPVSMERSVHLSFRTFQHKGHPHPVLSKSTPQNFPLALSPKIPRPTELETRPHPAMFAARIPWPA